MPQAKKGTSQDISTRVAALGKSIDAQRSAPATLNEQAKTVGVILATEAPVPVYDWDYGRVDEVLLMSGVEIPPSGQVPMLDSHNRWSVDAQIGSLRALSVQGDALYAEAHFSSTAEDAFTLVREGHLTDISVGYRVIERVFVPENTTQTIAGKAFTGPIKVVTRWEVKEGSFTPIGADKNAKTRAATGAEQGAVPPETPEIRNGQSPSSSFGQTREENPMPDVNTTAQGRAENQNAPAAPAQPQNNVAASAPADTTRSESTPPVTPPRATGTDAPPAPSAESAQSIRAEVAEIMMLGRMHNCHELAEQAIRGGVSLDQFRAQALEHIAQRSAQHAPGHMPHTEMGRDENEKFRSAVSDALCMRAGSQYAPKQAAAGAEQFRGYTLRELARECLRRSGVSIPHDPMEMIGRAFTVSTSDFPNILADTMHKAVLSGAKEAPETFEAWTGESNANDFRQHTGVDLNAFSGLDLVPEGREYTTGQISDKGIRYAVATYGKLFPLTRQMIINDDLNAFTQIPAAMGRAAMRTCGNAVYSLLLENPQLADGIALFAAGRNNLAATGSKITVDSYSEAVTAMGTHTGDQGEVLNITPAFMIVPVARKAEARILLNSQMIGTQAAPNQVNPWQGDVTPVVEGRLDVVSGKPWFLAGQKGWAINVAWLFGNKTPRVEQRQGWTVDGVEHKVSLDFGAYVQDPAALFKNPGA